MAEVTKKTEVDGDAEAPVPHRRVSPMQFLQEVRRELSKVTWPFGARSKATISL